MNPPSYWPIVLNDYPEMRPAILALPPVLLESEYRREQVGQDVLALAVGFRTTNGLRGRNPVIFDGPGFAPDADEFT